MEIVRKFEDVEIKVTITDDELLELIASKSLDERVVFFRKLMETDLAKTLSSLDPFNLLKLGNPK